MIIKESSHAEVLAVHGFVEEFVAEVKGKACSETDDFGVGVWLIIFNSFQFLFCEYALAASILARDKILEVTATEGGILCFVTVLFLTAEFFVAGELRLLSREDFY